MPKFQGGLMGRSGDLGASTTVPTITNQGTAGATTYTYKLLHNMDDGSKQMSVLASTTTGNATLNSTNFNRLAYTPPAGTLTTDVYRVSGGASQGKIGSTTGASVQQFDDTGLAGDSGTALAQTQAVDVTKLSGSVTVNIAGTMTATWVLEVSHDKGATWGQFDTGTAAKLSATLPATTRARVRLTAWTSGTNIVCSYGGVDQNRTDL